MSELHLLILRLFVDVGLCFARGRLVMEDYPDAEAE